MNMSLFPNVRKLACTLWSDKWMSLLNSFDDIALFVHKCGINEVTARPSSILHSRAGMGCYANQEFSKHESVKFYDRTLFKKDRSSFADNKVYGEGKMAISASDFCRSVI